MIVKIPLILDPQPEGGYTVTSPLLPELMTEGDTIAEAVANAEDAFAAVVEIYGDGGRALPPGISMDDADAPLSIERQVVTCAVAPLFPAPYSIRPRLV